ncbi:nucleoside diphosphate kinase 7 [Lucilia cuprina]|uniref:nucleoside diphosphate kinase 7 n=1 Tax=Lucilia cuprina TaxID=7375 RepID=UPI001F060BA1|nr:nucleoside diphosphate kinase 7 [Lucilia cuprina]
MATSNARRLCFTAEWYQEEAGIIRTFTILYYAHDNTIEVFDQRTKKTFLRRIKMTDLTERDFFVGSKINVFGRQFDIVDYGDDITKNTLAKYRKKTFILLKNSILQHLGLVLCSLIDSNFSISKGLMVHFTADQVKEFLNERNKGDVQTSVLMNQLLMGPSIGFELIADNAVEKIKNCVNQTRNEVNSDIPKALISLFEREDIRNGVYCSQNEEDVERDTNFFFDKQSGLQIAVQLKNSTLAVIKPHAIKEGNLGKIIKEITSNGFKITALRMHILEKVNCSEFYEVYRGIVPEYIPMVSQLASGVSMSLEIVCTDANKSSYEEFRKFCGPMDPEIAKLLRPHTLRAKYGSSKTLNAVHCTDLPDDTILEIQYLFKILD